MRTATRTAILGAAVTAAATTATPAYAASSEHEELPGAAVFVQTDATSGNSVVAYRQSPDGVLHLAGTYATGGNGGVLSGSVVDHLASQGSLLLDRRHHLLYAVNAGSSTLTVFGVRGSTLVRRQVVPTDGTFPVSVTASDGAVFVLNARNGGSIQGFRWVGGRLAAVGSWHRELGLAEPAPEFTHTPGQVAFTPDGRHLLVTTKAASNAVLVFGVRHGALATQPVVNSYPGAVPFAVDFDRRGRAVVAETGTNSVATFTVGRQGVLHSVATAATGQKATCWVVVGGRHAYASNAGSATLSGYLLRRGQLTASGVTPTDPGTVDAAISGDHRYLHVQTGAQGKVDTFRIGRNGALTAVGSTVVTDAVGGEGIAAE